MVEKGVEFKVEQINPFAPPPEFLAINSFAQIPVLDDDGVIIPDSNAIMVYLAKKCGRTDWLPETPREAAAVQRWLSAAAGELYRGPCSARMFTVRPTIFNLNET